MDIWRSYISHSSATWILESIFQIPLAVLPLWAWKLLQSTISPYDNLVMNLKLTVILNHLLWDWRKLIHQGPNFPLRLLTKWATTSCELIFLCCMGLIADRISTVLEETPWVLFLLETVHPCCLLFEFWETVFANSSIECIRQQKSIPTLPGRLIILLLLLLL